jgi:hypothetical protein
MWLSGARQCGRIGNPVKFRNVPNAVKGDGLCKTPLEKSGKARRSSEPQSEDRPDVIALFHMDGGVSICAYCRVSHNAE